MIAITFIVNTELTQNSFASCKLLRLVIQLHINTVTVIVTVTVTDQTMKKTSNCGNIGDAAREAGTQFQTF